MKHLLNTLYVTTHGAYLSKEGDTVVVSVDREEKLRVPVHILSSIVCFGNISCTPFLLGLCGQHNITVSFMSQYGRFLGRVHGPVHGNVLLRREQYRRADDVSCAAEIARLIVMAKIANSRTVLLRAVRDRPESPSAPDLAEAAKRLSGILKRVRDPTSLDSVRGAEGIAATEYFGIFDNLITTQKEDFFFRGRSRRPPLDRMNALLSFYYTLLTHDCSSALEGVGLDPAVGFLHRDRPGRPSLALDLVEELRPVLADRLALTLVNRRQLSPSDFKVTESGAVLMVDDARKKVLVAYQERKQEELTHPFLKEKVAVGLLPHIQALLLA
ncbi:MAG: type I-C CRISPR-associated endonuclease Cas1c, partial [Candidatus Zixiibacteriota bacterium]